MTIEKTRSGLRGRQLQGHMLTFALDSETDALLARARSASDGHASKTLVRQEAMRITLVALREGASLRPHHVDGPSSLQVLRGKLRFTTDHGDVFILVEGLVTLAAGVINEAAALSDSALLLTIIKP